MRQCPLCSRLYDEAAEFCPQDGRVLLLPDALLGRVVDGKYRIDSLLGGGGQSSVYRATHVMLERPAALKVVRGAVASDAEAMARFRREALAVAHLKHASIVTVHDFGIDDAAGAYLVMELLDGRSLGREILETGRLAPDEAVAVMRHVCSALTTAHAAGIVHRDLKPDNIFLETRPDGQRAVKILDFGIAKLRNAAQLSALDGGYDTDPNVSISVPFGTAAYMSPEQCRAEPVDARSDIYSIGCVFYEMLAGRPPFLSDAVGSLCESHVEATPEPPSAYAPGLPAGLDEIVLTALAKRPEDRHQTAEALERALDEAVARTPVHGAPRVTTGPLELRGRAAQRDRAARTNLAGEITTFVGRAEELAAVRGALGGSRLVTVTGSSGAGKTRLAERLGAELLDEFPDGVWQARFAPISEPSLVPKAVASALGIREDTGRPPVRSLIDFLQGKRLLLLLDNCEHLVAACAELADALLRACPFVRVLATSQEPLGIFGEAVHPLPPLSLPREGEAPSFEEIAWFEAIQLFVDRARLAAPSFALTPANAPVVVRVCQRLDGIPLAIELAAARTKLLPVEQIDARLHDRFRLLTSGSRTADPRQRTLQAAIDWSHDLLEEGGRTLFRRLSIFSGGFTLELAETVTAGGGIARDEVLYLLSNLVDKSLVLVNESGATARYRMLQTIRQYAGERLRASGEAASVRAKHRDAFLALAEHAEGELKGPEQDVWLDRLEAEHANLRAALEWSKTDAAASDAYLRLAGALWEYWLVRGHVREGREWLESALTLSSPAFDAPRARALDGAGVLARLQGDYQQAVRRHQEGITLWRKIGDRAGEAGAITHLGIVRQWQGDTDRARQLLEEALALSREVDNPWGVALALKNLGVIAHVLGETERATERYRESLEISRSLDDAWEIASTINNLAVLLASQGEYERAAELFEENLSLNRRLGEKRGIAMALNNLGEMAQSQGDYGRAAELLSESLLLNVDAGNARLIAYGLECFVSLLAAEGCDEKALRLASAAEALRDRIGSPLSPAEREDLDRSIAAARAALTPEHAARAWEDGRAMSIEEAVDEALSPGESMDTREILHYRIEASLGKGGMGEVFRAKDTRLGRTVALKFLPDTVARDAERRARFMLEAQAASRLSSPHIATLFDVGEHDGAMFLVMEYVEGEPLSARIARGAMAVPDAVDVAAQMAQALAAAHERGVVHRDVKPSNVMLVPPSQVKMLDFGLAKLVDPAPIEPPTVVIPPLTLPGSILGTFDYMSPEQALGDEVDHRTDIFSLGVVLYEMLCGVRPFRGDTHMRVMDQIVHAPTPALVGRAAHAPESVASVVRRALEKDPARRYQSAREMAGELAAWKSAPATEIAPSAGSSPGPSGSGSGSGAAAALASNAVAVTTFVNVTRRPEDDWLGTGIAETVTADLKRVKGLSVIDRERVCCADATLANCGADASDPAFAVTAGRALGVTWIVGGGFQRSGDHLRITARFSDARSGAVLRTIKIDGSVEAIFDLQDRIVEELCDGLDLDLLRSEIAAIERKETHSVDAYRAYSRGLAELRAGAPEAFERAIEHLAEAVQLDSNYSVAWAALGSAYCLKGLFLAQRELVREALDFERKALAIDPNNALAHEWLSMAHLYLGEVEEAVVASREAMRLDPQLASARAAHGRAYWLGRGMVEEGIRELERATALDPNLGYAYLQLGYLYAIVGDFERAEAASRRAVELEDRNASGTLGLKMVGARTRLGYVFYRTGRHDEALAEYLTERETIEASAHALRERALVELDQKLGAVYLALGRDAEAAEHLERAVERSRARAERRPLDPSTAYYLACAHALRGEVAPALEAFKRAMSHHPKVTARRGASDPDLAALAAEPEFVHLTTPEDDAYATNVG